MIDRFTEIESGLWMGACPVDEAPDFADAILDVYARHEYDRGGPDVPRRAAARLRRSPRPGPARVARPLGGRAARRGPDRADPLRGRPEPLRTLTALYLIRYRGYDPEAAIALVQEKRGPNALWNGSFLQYLRESTTTP